METRNDGDTEEGPSLGGGGGQESLLGEHDGI